MRVNRFVSFLSLVTLLVLPAVAGANIAENAVAKRGPERSVACDPSAEGCVRDLVAGQHTVVGTVSVEAGPGGDLLVTYDTTGSDWWLTEIHFEASTDPITSSAPGQFGSKPYLDGPVQFFQFSVAPPDDGDTCGNEGDGYYYAAHAVVKMADSESSVDLTLPDLPETVDFIVNGGGSSYFTTTVLTSDLAAGSPYSGWCIDLDRLIYTGQTYTAQVYSSYEPLPPGAVDNPDMLDEVNWLINQGFVGQTSTGCGGTYSAYDVQVAIWLLLEDSSPLSSCRAQELADAARNFGSGFEPGCGDLIAVVLVPFNATGGIGAQVTVISAQVTAIADELSCEPQSSDGDETAWACGDFIRPGKNWAMSFQCCAVSPN